MKKLIAVLLFVVAVCVGCSGGKSPSTKTAKSAASNIVYSMDERTGLCFGTISSNTYSGYSVVAMTNVPCESVKHLLVK